MIQQHEVTLVKQTKQNKQNENENNKTVLYIMAVAIAIVLQLFLSVHILFTSNNNYSQAISEWGRQNGVPYIVSSFGPNRKTNKQSLLLIIIIITTIITPSSYG